MKVCYRIAAVRRQVKQLVAIAAERAAREARWECVEISATASYRSLTAAEAEALVGGELLASLTDVIRS